MTDKTTKSPNTVLAMFLSYFVFMRIIAYIIPQGKGFPQSNYCHPSDDG